MNADTEVKVELLASAIPAGATVETEVGRYTLIRDPHFLRYRASGNISVSDDRICGTWLYSAMECDSMQWVAGKRPILIKVDDDPILTWVTTAGFISTFLLETGNA